MSEGGKAVTVTDIFTYFPVSHHSLPLFSHSNVSPTLLKESWLAEDFLENQMCSVLDSSADTCNRNLYFSLLPYYSGCWWFLILLFFTCLNSTQFHILRLAAVHWLPSSLLSPSLSCPLKVALSLSLLLSWHNNNNRASVVVQQSCQQSHMVLFWSLSFSAKEGDSFEYEYTVCQIPCALWGALLSHKSAPWLSWSRRAAAASTYLCMWIYYIPEWFVLISLQLSGASSLSMAQARSHLNWRDWGQPYDADAELLFPLELISCLCSFCFPSVSTHDSTTLRNVFYVFYSLACYMPSGVTAGKLARSTCTLFLVIWLSPWENRQRHQHR